MTVGWKLDDKFSIEDIRKEHGPVIAAVAEQAFMSGAQMAQIAMAHGHAMVMGCACEGAEISKRAMRRGANLDCA